MLASCTDFKERQNLRGALRELKGIKLDGDTGVTYSFASKSTKKTPTLTSPKTENGRVFPKQTNYKSVDENSFLERKYNKVVDKANIIKARNRRIGNESPKTDVIVTSRAKLKSETNDDVRTNTKVNRVQETKKDATPSGTNRFELIKSNFEKSSNESSSSSSNVQEILSESFKNRVNDIKSTFEKQRDDKPKFCSYHYAGSLTTPTKQLEEDKVVPAQRCVSVSIVSNNEITNNTSDISNKESVIKRSVSSLDLRSNHNHQHDSHKDPSLSTLPPKPDIKQSPRKPRRISYRTSAFSQSSQPDQISSSVSNNRLKYASTGVDSVWDKVGSETISNGEATNQIALNSSIKHPVTNKNSRYSALHPNGRHSVPILTDKHSSSNYTDKQSIIDKPGKRTVASKDTDCVVNAAHGQPKSNVSSRHSHSKHHSTTGHPSRKSETEIIKGKIKHSSQHTDHNKNMRAEPGRRHASDSTVTIQNLKNELNNAQNGEAERIRSRSHGCPSDITSENIMEISLQKRKAALSRKNRVDTLDSTKTVRKYRKKTQTDEEPLTSPNTPQPSDIIMSPVNGEFHAKPVIVHRQVHVRRKLPEIPVFNFEQEAENDETVHERTIRLLQERRKDRLGKIIKEKEVETKPPKSNKVTPEQIKSLEEKLERSDSKRKACRVRRELQLLNRETKLKSPIPIKLEAEFSAILKAGEAVVERDTVQLPLQRSQSDVGRKPSGMEFEVSCREPVKQEVRLERSVSAVQEVDGFLSQPLTPDKKIDLIGQLMQEEARLQEMLRRSTSFTDKRNMRAEVKQLREKRNAIEGASLPTPTLKRSASVSSGVITHASTPDGIRVTEPDHVPKQSTLDELRKQLNETTDYDEKKKIRLALRQLRQKSKDGTPSQTGLQRSQSFVHKKTSERQVEPEAQSGDVPVFRHRSVSESKLPADEQSVKTVPSEPRGEEVCVKKSSVQLESESNHQTREIRHSNHSNKSGTVLAGATHSSSNPLIPLSHKQSVIVNGVTRRKSVEAGSLPPRAPKRHSFSVGTEPKLEHHTNSILDGSHKYSSVDSGSDSGSQPGSSSRAQTEVKTEASTQKQPSVQTNEAKFKSKFANILVSRSYLDRRKSTSDIKSEVGKPSTGRVSHDNKSLIRSETTSLRVTDTEAEHHKSATERPSVKSDIESDSRITPNIEWLEDKKRTIPTPNELDKLMSSMDIEAAFSQILDAVETEPTTNGNIFDTQVPDSPIMEEELSSESSTSSVAELTNIIADSQHKVVGGIGKETTSAVNHKVLSNGHSEGDDNDANIHSVGSKELTNKTVGDEENHKCISNEIGNKDAHGQSDEITNVKDGERNGGSNDKQQLSEMVVDKSDGAIKEDRHKQHSEKTIQLRNDLSLDVSQSADASSAISVIHGDDGTVTVQEVNRIEEGDTVITELKKVHRSLSRSETRETDTIVERKVTTPGGTSQTYEKDVSKTKRKLTSRGSEYFSRNHYNIRKKRDLAGEEIVEHELDSESSNVSVSKNESWGERSEAKVVLNRDVNNEILPRRLSIAKNNVDGKSEFTANTEENSRDQPVDRSNARANASTGPGCLSPSQDDHDLAAVVEAHLGRPSGCPEITSPIQNITSTEGETAVLEFKFKGQPQPHVTWYKGDNPLTESETIKFVFDGVAGLAQLEISPVGLGDLGDFKCVVRNSLGTASTTGRLNVKSKALTVPWFLTKLNDVTVTEGQSITLECKVSDVDKVMWFKDGIIQRNSPDLRQTFDGRIARLEIIEVYLDDDGTYSCVISNKAGDNGCSCKISVNESQSKDSIVPMFLRKLDTQICDVGDTAIFETEVIGSPEPTITWFVNRNQLTKADCHQMEYDGRIARLVLRKIGLSHGGKLECMAENSSGRVSCDCTVVVQEVQKPPVATTELSDMTFTSGKAAILECTIESDSTPDISWRKNGFVIGHMFDFKQTFVDGVARLEIGKACTQDSGNYDCLIKNEFGEVVTSCFLTIQDEVLKQEEPKLSMKETKSEAPRSVPASFTPKLENERKHQAKSSASKVMLVRRASLRSVDHEPKPSIVKRTASFNTASARQSFINNRIELIEAGKDKSINEAFKKNNKINNFNMPVTDVTKLLNEKEEITKTEQASSSDSSVDHVVGGAYGNRLQQEEKIADSDETPAMKEMSLNKSDLDENYTKDFNSNITKVKSNSEGGLEDINKPQKLEMLIDSGKHSQTLGSSKVEEKTQASVESKPPKLEVLIDSNKPLQAAGSSKFEEKTQVSEDKEGKLAAGISKGTSFGTGDKTPLSRFKTGGELRRTQSTRTPGSEKPEWLQVKLRKVTNTPLSNSEKQSIEKNSNFNTPREVTSPSSSSSVTSDVSSTPVSVQKETKLSRSQSARVVDRKISPVLKDSTNSPSFDPARKTVKLTPVSERAKMFLESSSPSGKSSPTDIISKAINLSRAESLRSPVGQRPFVVQRSGSFKTETPTNPPGDITLNLKPQDSQGKEREGSSSSIRKDIDIWDPSAPASTKMADISKITDEEELTKMLNGCENFEERKKLRARIKELRDIEYKEWDAKRAEREKNHEDAIKLKHKEADLQKQRKLDMYAEQAKQQHDPKHLDIAEQHIKEKYRQADIDKQKRLEAFDKMARKEDVKQTSTVSTEVSTDGKTTTTTRKVATTTSVTGRGATGRPAAKPVNPFKAADAANAKTNPLVAYTFAKRAATTMKRNAVGIKQDVLYFCQQNTAEYEVLEAKLLSYQWDHKIKIENFSTSWNDGIAFCALIHHFYPDSFDFYGLDPKQRRKNFELAFDTAEKYADIAPLLDVEDMVRMKKPDWKCVFCYVQSFYRKLKDHERNKTLPAPAEA